jgi:hypothetical protein
LVRGLVFILNTLNQGGEIVSLGEETINILQLQALGLRVEEVDDRNPAGVEDSEDNISPPTDVLDGRYINVMLVFFPLLL